MGDSTLNSAQQNFENMNLETDQKYKEMKKFSEAVLNGDFEAASSSFMAMIQFGSRYDLKILKVNPVDSSNNAISNANIQRLPENLAGALQYYENTDFESQYQNKILEYQQRVENEQRQMEQEAFKQVQLREIIKKQKMEQEERQKLEQQKKEQENLKSHQEQSQTFQPQQQQQFGVQKNNFNYNRVVSNSYAPQQDEQEAQPSQMINQQSPQINNVQPPQSFQQLFQGNMPYQVHGNNQQFPIMNNPIPANNPQGPFQQEHHQAKTQGYRFNQQQMNPPNQNQAINQTVNNMYQQQNNNNFNRITPQMKSYQNQQGNQQNQQQPQFGSQPFNFAQQKYPNVNIQNSNQVNPNQPFFNQQPMQIPQQPGNLPYQQLQVGGSVNQSANAFNTNFQYNGGLYQSEKFPLQQSQSPNPVQQKTQDNSKQPSRVIEEEDQSELTSHTS